MAFYCDTSAKLKEIFAEHCNLSTEQYEEISGRLIYLVADIQMLEEKNPEVKIKDAETEACELRVIYEFLLNTKELTLEEYNRLCDMTNGLEDAARKAAEG